MGPRKSNSFSILFAVLVALLALAASTYFWRFEGPASHQSATNFVTSLDVVPGPKPDSSSSSTPGKSSAADPPQHGPKSNSITVPQRINAIDARTAVNCHRALLKKKHLEKRNCDNIKVEDVVGLRICQDGLADDYAWLQQLSAEAASCPKELAATSEFYKALRDAALNGDDDARRCFIQGYFEDTEAGDVLNPEQKDKYVLLARQFIESLIQRGDLAVVRWLARPRIYIGDGLLREAYPIGAEHPDTVYKMNFLLQLSGRTEHGAKDAREIVDAYRINGRLSPDELRAAEQWARDTYSRYFAAMPNIGPTAATSFCPNQ